MSSLERRPHTPGLGSRSGTLPDLASFWQGEELGPYEEMVIRSAINQGHSFHLYSYKDMTSIDGVNLFSADEIVPKHDANYRFLNEGRYSLFSNYFRYCLLQKFQGIWIDLDVLVLAPLSLPPHGYLFGFEEPARVNGAVLAAPSESEFLEYLVQQFRRRVESNDLRWGRLGPELVTDAVNRYGLWSYVRPRRDFYPLYFREAWRFFDPDSNQLIVRKTQLSRAVHLWNEVLRGPNNSRKKQKPPGSSFLGRHLVAVDANFASDGPVMSADYPRRIWAPSTYDARARSRKAVYWVFGVISGVFGAGVLPLIHRFRRFTGV